MSGSNLRVGQHAHAQLVRAGDKMLPEHGPSVSLINECSLTGRIVMQHFRDGKRFNEYHFNNGIVNEGKNSLLDIMFNASTQIAAWFLGLIDNNSFSALASDDTYDDIDQAGNGWDEFQSYTDANNGDSATTRPEWGPDPASGQSITNSTVAIYDVTGSGTVKGVFAVGTTGTPATSSQLKGNHDAGPVLWATALFTSGDVAVQNGDQLKVTYTVSA